jgi:hypothetical protein
LTDRFKEDFITSDEEKAELATKNSQKKLEDTAKRVTTLVGDGGKEKEKRDAATALLNKLGGLEAVLNRLNRAGQLSEVLEENIAVTEGIGTIQDALTILDPIAFAKAIKDGNLFLIAKFKAVFRNVLDYQNKVDTSIEDIKKLLFDLSTDRNKNSNDVELKKLLNRLNEKFDDLAIDVNKLRNKDVGLLEKASKNLLKIMEAQNDDLTNAIGLQAKDKVGDSEWRRTMELCRQPSYMDSLTLVTTEQES